MTRRHCQRPLRLPCERGCTIGQTTRTHVRQLLHLIRATSHPLDNSKFEMSYYRERTPRYLMSVPHVHVVCLPTCTRGKGDRQIDPQHRSSIHHPSVHPSLMPVQCSTVPVAEQWPVGLATHNDSRKNNVRWRRRRQRARCFTSRRRGRMSSEASQDHTSLP